MNFPLDIFRHLSRFLDVKAFVNLTSCCKSLRRLYHDQNIWKFYLERDFKNKPHYTCDIETYKFYYEGALWTCKSPVSNNTITFTSRKDAMDYMTNEATTFWYNRKDWNFDRINSGTRIIIRKKNISYVWEVRAYSKMFKCKV